MSIEVVPLDFSTFEEFLVICEQRGESPEDYYRWKYLTPLTSRLPRGFVARLKGKAVGCIGVIPREWRDTDGTGKPANWFADWYVSAQARGNGIGIRLLQEVAHSTPYSCGIPGPAHAQTVALRAGYSNRQKDYEDIYFPIRQLQFGWKRGGGLLLRPMLRVMRELRENSMSHLIGKAQPLIFEFPNCDMWSRDGEASLEDQPHFVRSVEHLSWLREMPSTKSNPKLWWHWNVENLSALGYVDRDRYGLRRSRILDFWDLDALSYQSLPWQQLLRAHREQKIDYLVIYGNMNGKFEEHPARLRHHIPLFSQPAMSSIESVGIDRENWWRDIKMHKMEV